MRKTRKTINSHHSADIAGLFQEMKKAIFPENSSDAQFKKYLFAIQHVERYRAQEGKGGRPSRYDRKKLLTDAARLKMLLAAKGDSAPSLLYFIANWLPVLGYPTDVRAALDDGKINLDEARSLSRLNKKNMGNKTKRKPVEIRRELLRSHLKRRGTQNELRMRVKERLADGAKASAKAVSTVMAAMDGQVDELIAFNERDTEHLFWEEIKALVFLAREIQVDEIGEEPLKEILNDLGSIFNKLFKYKPLPAVRWWEEKK